MKFFIRLGYICLGLALTNFGIGYTMSCFKK